jgi:FemAB-related protein (PEP-CTERM system-associated)
MQVEPMAERGSEWDAFVATTPEAPLGQAAAWASVLRESYGLAPHYLGLRSAGRGDLLGVLPLVLFFSPRGRRELVSLPFLDAAGIVAGDASAELALLEGALRLAREHGARALELRQPDPLCAAPAQAAADRVGFALPLAASEDLQWSSLPAKVRNQTRKARREGLRIASGSPDALRRAFYRVLCVNMRDLGSPVHAERFFAAAAARFGPALRFIVATRDERPVGGLVAIRHGRTVSVPWASTLRSERARCPNNLIYWEALRWAIAGGAARFDFGRSPRDSGSYRFKRGWGAEERPLAWTRLAPDGAPLPLRRAQDSAVLRRLSTLWTALPVPVSAVLGPGLRRYLSE